MPNALLMLFAPLPSHLHRFFMHDTCGSRLVSNHMFLFFSRLQARAPCLSSQQQLHQASRV